jgi:hypothetical protein
VQVRDAAKPRIDKMLTWFVSEFEKAVAEGLGDAAVRLDTFLAVVLEAKAFGQLRDEANELRAAFAWCRSFLAAGLLFGSGVAVLADGASDLQAWAAYLPVVDTLRSLQIPLGSEKMLLDILGASCIDKVTDFAVSAASSDSVQQLRARPMLMLNNVLDKYTAACNEPPSDPNTTLINVALHNCKAMAEETRDSKLVNQLNFFADLELLKSCLVKLSLKDASSKTREDKAFSSSWCELLRPVRSRLQATRDMLTNDSRTVVLTNLFSKDGDKLHCETFDGPDPVPSMKSLCEMSETLLQSLYSNWSSDLSQLCDVVSQMCPAWQPVAGDPNLLTKDFVKALLSNPSYPKLTPSCNVLVLMLDTHKSLMLDTHGAIFTPELCKKALEVKALGYDTVSFTYAVYQTSLAIPKLSSDALKANAVKDLRAALLAKNFKDIPKSLENRMLALTGQPPP